VSPLTPSQKSRLRSAARTARPDATIGKGGIPAAANHVAVILERQEVVKVRLPASDAAGRFAAADELAKALQAEIVDVVGRMVVLYKANAAKNND
jgi:RNA-binding protein